MAEIARLDVILGGDTSQFNSAMKVANDSLVSFAKTSQAAAQLQPFSKATAGALNAARSVQQLNDVLAQLKIEQAAVNNPTELLAYNNAIKATTLQVKELSAAGSSGGIGSIGKSLTGALSSVRQLAYILPGIGIAGIFNIAFQAITEVVTELDLFGQEASKAAKYSADLGDAIGKENAGLNTELVKLSALVQVARDHSASLQARKSAISELQKEYPGYLSNINLENINSQEAANAIGKLTDALQRKALVQAYSNLLTKASEDLIKAQNSDLIDNVSLLDKAVAILKNPANTGAAGADLAAKAFKNQASSVKDLQGVVDSLSHSLAGLTEEQAKNNDFSLLSPTKAKAAKKTKAEEFISFDPSTIEIDRNAEAKVWINAFGVKLSDEVNKTLNKNGAVTVRPKIILDPRIVNAQKLSSELTAALQDIAVRGAEAFGESIGNLLGGEKNPFNNLTRVIGQGIKELGALMIKYGVLAELANKALELGPIGGALALVAGIGLEALGAYIEAKGGVKTHAQGGIFTQPTMWGNHLIGEAGPEALVPLNRMGELGTGIGGGKQVIEVVGRISGNDLILIQNRAQVANNRAYGNNFNRRN